MRMLTDVLDECQRENVRLADLAHEQRERADAAESSLSALQTEVRALREQVKGLEALEPWVERWPKEPT